MVIVWRVARALSISDSFVTMLKSIQRKSGLKSRDCHCGAYAHVLVGGCGDERPNDSVGDSADALDAANPMTQLVEDATLQTKPS